MFGKKTKPAPSQPKKQIASQLEPDVKLVGDISFSGLLQLKGNIYGNVIAPADSDATLLVEPSATITTKNRTLNDCLSHTLPWSIKITFIKKLTMTPLSEQAVNTCCDSTELEREIIRFVQRSDLYRARLSTIMTA